MEVVIPVAVAQQLRGLPKADAGRVLDALDEIARRYPLPVSFARQMRHQSDDIWRMRKGDYRALYQIAGNELRVIKVSHRKDVYE